MALNFTVHFVLKVRLWTTALWPSVHVLLFNLPDMVKPSLISPHPWADRTSRFLFGSYNLHHRDIGVQSWRFCFLDPPGALGQQGCPTDMRYLLEWLKYLM